MAVFGLLLKKTFHGVGQYWDWVFPFYPDQIGTFFGRAAEAWTNDANGSPLSYSTDYLLRFIISLFKWMQPELLLYLLLVTLFAAGAYGIYKAAVRHTTPVVSFLLGLFAFANPVTFYNFTAGYIDFLVAYSVFIYLLYFMLYRYRSDLRSAVIVGLLITAIGVQIQLFFVAGALIVLFFALRPSVWRWRDGAMMFGLPLVISLIWLSNFLFGGADVASISESAAKNSFKGLADAPFLNMFNFTFSKATLISRFYSPFELLLYGLFFIFVVLALIYSVRKKMNDVLLLAFMLLMLFLSTGFFMTIDLGPLTKLYPMFREVGHFVPLMVLAMIFLLARLMPQGRARKLCVGWLVVMIIVSFARYDANPQSIDFGNVRQQFAEFKTFGDAHASPDYRVLAYPFFDQYAFTKFPITFQDELPLRNSGHDSFTAMNRQQFVKNAIKPHQFQTSVQHALLQTHDIDVLRSYNVRYIYDFSDIYESYYERYVAPATYNNDVGLIKNDPAFLDKLLAANPGKLKRVSEHIVEVTDYTPRVAATDSIHAVPSVDDGERAQPFMKQVFPDKTYTYTTDGKTSPPPGSSSVAPLFTDMSTPFANTRTKALEQTIRFPGATNRATVYSNTKPNELMYKIDQGMIMFYLAGSGKLYADAQLIRDNTTDIAKKEISRIPMVKNQRYYAIVNGNVLPLEKSEGKIGQLGREKTLEIYTTAGQNMIGNPSFETGLWKDRVDDCNAYDKNGDIGMSRDQTEHSDGQYALQLSARRHDACTSASFAMNGGAHYLLQYDYQSPNAQNASAYVRFNNKDEGAIKRLQTVTDSQWHTATQLITSPAGTTQGQITVHAQASDKTAPTINRYDNVTMQQLQKLADVTIPEVEYDYTSTQLKPGDHTAFQFSDPSYDYKNVINNGSFEQGGWQDTVTDCHNYDKNGKVAASLTRQSKSDGGQSLQLEATRHIACQYTNAAVESGTDYLLSFDYQGDDAQQAGYYIAFDGQTDGAQGQVPITDRQWHTYRTKIRVPELATSLRLHVHAYESNGSANNIVRFDNVKLIAIPSTDQQFYAVSDPPSSLVQPRKIEFRTDSITKKTVSVTGATAPFIATLSETYHPGWRLALRDSRTTGPGSWVPGLRAKAAPEHFQINNYANGWYVDPAALCANNAQGCVKQADGSYNIQMIAEFTPQRWFVINRIIAVSALLGALWYVLFVSRSSIRPYGAHLRGLLHRLTINRSKK